ncbi:hypothetical protein ACQKDA_00175 [Psychrobacter sp. NPDC078370]|uniref:hypothetical protein n=1 Tax=unclassified Psychrobacter TaxID=196806 RepID=UPI003D08EB1A
MRVSFVLNANQDIKQVMEDRIRVLEHNFNMEVQGFAIKQISKTDFDCNYESLGSEEVKQALSGWECELQFEIQLEFKELSRDE